MLCYFFFRPQKSTFLLVQIAVAFANPSTMGDKFFHKVLDLFLFFFRSIHLHQSFFDIRKCILSQILINMSASPACGLPSLAPHMVSSRTPISVFHELGFHLAHERFLKTPRDSVECWFSSKAIVWSSRSQIHLQVHWLCVFVHFSSCLQHKINDDFCRSLSFVNCWSHFASGNLTSFLHVNLRQFCHFLSPSLSSWIHFCCSSVFGFHPVHFFFLFLFGKLPVRSSSRILAKMG